MSFAIERMIGRWLKHIRIGAHDLACEDARFAATPQSIQLTSSAFAEGGFIPQRYAGRGVGENLSPPLAWSNLPKATLELVLILQDPDAPLPHPLVHLIVAGLPPAWREVSEGLLTPKSAPALKFGRGFLGRSGYEGPRPVRGHGPHRYVFQIFALKRRLDFAAVPDLKALTAAMTGAVLARGTLTGIYERR